MLFFNANFICYYFYPTKKREEPFLLHEKIPWEKAEAVRGAGAGRPEKKDSKKGDATHLL